MPKATVDGLVKVSNRDVVIRKDKAQLATSSAARLLKRAFTIRESKRPLEKAGVVRRRTPPALQLETQPSPFMLRQKTTAALLQLAPSPRSSKVVKGSHHRHERGKHEGDYLHKSVEHPE